MLKYELENILNFLFSFSRVFFSVSELIEAKSKYAPMWKVNRLRNIMKIKSSQNIGHRDQRYILELWFRFIIQAHVFPHWLISTVNRVRIDHQSLRRSLDETKTLEPLTVTARRDTKKSTAKGLYKILAASRRHC